VQNNLVETLIGAVVLVVAGAFLVFAYSNVGLGAGTGGYDLKARFERVDGLVTGADVRMSGIKIGSVTSQVLDPKTYSAIVNFSVAGDVRLPEDSAAKITSDGLLGGAYLSLEPGGSDRMLAPGGEIRLTQGSVNLIDLIGKAIFSAASPAEKPAN
jgi:phospholipid/cholesterol/gamma-HCH transport system substrate-binding protein